MSYLEWFYIASMILSLFVCLFANRITKENIISPLCFIMSFVAFMNTVVGIIGICAIVVSLYTRHLIQKNLDMVIGEFKL